ncbi:Endoribonuclease Dicer, partial [Halocaridina rubra]
MACTQISVTHPTAGTDTRIHVLTPEPTIMMNSQQNHTVETHHEQFQEQTTTMTMDTTLMKHDNVDFQVEILTKVFCECLDSCAPIATRKITRPSAPWLTNDIKEAMHIRNQIQKELKINRYDMILQERYKIEKKRVRSLINVSKKDFYKKQFNDPRYDTAASWKVIRGMIPNEKTTSESSEYITELKDKADYFNNYFANVGKNTYEKTQEDVNSVNMSNCFKGQFFHYFGWPPLDFGWSLADVLKKNQDTQQQQQESFENSDNNISKPKTKKQDSCGNDSLSTSNKRVTKNGTDMEIGTWSNDMAVDPPTPPFNADEDMNTVEDFEIDTFDPNVALPDNLTLLEGFTASDDVEGELGADWGTGITERRTKSGCHREINGEVFRVGSPSNFESDSWDIFGGRGHSGYGSYGGYDSYGGYGDFQGLADDLEGCESDVSSDIDDDDKSQMDKIWNEDGGKARAGLIVDEGSSDEEVDYHWPSDDNFIKEKELHFQMYLDKTYECILKSSNYLGEDEPLIIEKACRKNVTSECKFTPSLQIVSPSRSVPQGCEPKVLKDCDNAQQSTSPVVRTVNRIETLTIRVPDSNDDKSLWNSEYNEGLFSFDFQPDLASHPGPSPSVILQALTMSNANDGVNLERLETIGDSFLKYAITTFLYCTYPHRHEGKLSYLRSKQVSNLNLYRLGKRKGLGECMVATKFEPHDNWLPPGYFVPRELEEALIDSGVPAGHWNMADLPGLHDLASDEIRRLVQERSEQIKRNKTEQASADLIATQNPHDLPIFIPYNLLTQHSIPDKSIADCVEALIGAYLTTCGPRGALLFMSWLGIEVLPYEVEILPTGERITYGHLDPPQSPLHHCPISQTEEQLELLLSGYQVFEEKIGYFFQDRSYLLQAFTHASYYKNRLTDCYQRLEFLGDAVLDYLITRHLYEDKRQHSPGALTDLRSALVNNTIFASLAVKYDYHKYFRHFSPGLDRVVRDFVKMQEENGHKINEE